MYEAHVKLIGDTPILLNPATRELMEQLEGRVKTSGTRGTKLSNEEKVEKIRQYFRDEFGALGLPRKYIVANLVNAGRKVKWDSKSNFTNAAKATLLWSCIELHTPQFLPFTPAVDFDDMVVDVQKGTNPNGGEAVVIARGRVDSWGFEFDITVNDDAHLPVGKLGDLFEIGGTAWGLGDFRPQKGGDFGQYTAEITVTRKAKGSASRVTIIDDIPEPNAAAKATSEPELVGAGVGSNGSDPS